jgi:hypothetical protein
MPERAARPRRLLWVQLGVPDADQAFAESNLPVAAGYVLGYCRGRGLLDGLNAAVLDEATATFAGDAGLLEAVLDRRPDVLCLSCYMWNVERSLWLAGRVRERRPGVRVILGGPEITPGGPAWDGAAADALVAGEGETGLPLALVALACGDERPIRIPAPPLADLDGAADPYSQGILPPGLKGNCILETTRGCPCRCHYCFYSKSARTVRHHPDDAVRNFFRWAARDGRVRDVYLLDPSFNRARGTRGRLRALAGWNRTGLDLHTESRLEGIDAELAAAYARAGFRSLEAGLQSIHPAVCAGVGRRLDLPAFAAGAAHLAGAGLNLDIGVILGLPDDGPAGFRDTLRWLHGRGLAESAEVFLLSLIPGTALRERAAAAGWRWMARPPYYLLAAGEWDEVRLLQGIYDVEEILDRQHHVDIPPYGDGLTPGGWLDRLDLDADRPDAAAALDAALPRLAAVATLEFRCADPDAAADRIARLGERMLAACPFGLFRVVLRGGRPVSSGAAAAIQRAFTRPDQYWNRVNYYRDDPTGVYSCRLFQRVPADRWREWLDRLPGWLDLVFEPPPEPEAFDRLTAALFGRLRPGQAFLAGGGGLGEACRRRVAHAVDVLGVFGRWQPQAD